LSIIDDMRPRSLADLLASGDSYTALFVQTMREIDAALPDELHHVDRLVSSSAHRALACALSFACQTQNLANIERGRAGVLAMPRRWVVARIVPVAVSALDIHDEWEFRRFLEVLGLLDAGLAKAFISGVKFGLAEDLREAADDVLQLIGAG